MGRNHPESAAQFRSAQTGDRRPGWLRSKAAIGAALLIALPGGAAALMGEGGTQATTPTPPSHSKIVDMTCHVSAGAAGHSSNPDQKHHALGDQGWQHFKNKTDHVVNVVFGTWVDIKRDRYPGESGNDKWNLYKQTIPNVPPGYTARMKWIVDQSATSGGAHMTCSVPVFSKAPRVSA